MLGIWLSWSGVQAFLLVFTDPVIDWFVGLTLVLVLLPTIKPDRFRF
jgi:hypothetical protein